MLKRIAVFLILFSMGYFSPASEGEYGGRLDFILSCKKIDPADINRQFPGLLSEPLCRLNADGTPYSNVFKSFSFDEEMLTLTLELSEGLKWSDGSPLKADDIYGALGAFVVKARREGYIADGGETQTMIFHTPVIKIMLQKSPDPVFYYMMSKTPLVDGMDKNRWTGPFVPQRQSSDGSLLLIGNIYSLSGKPFLAELVLHPDINNRIAASLLSLACGGADFDLAPPSYCEGEEDTFSIYTKNVVFLLSIGEGIPIQHRIKIASLIKSFDFVKGIAKGNAEKLEEFPLNGRETEPAQQPEANPAEAQSGEQHEQAVGTPQACPLIEIHYPPRSLFPSLAERIVAILQSAGYQSVKKPGEADGKTEGGNDNVISILMIDITGSGTEPWYSGMLDLLDSLSQLDFPGLFKDDTPDMEVFRFVEKRLSESGRLLYLFRAQVFRVFTCNIQGEGGFENYYISKSDN